MGVRSLDNSIMESSESHGEMHCPMPSKPRNLMGDMLEDMDEGEGKVAPADTAISTKTTTAAGGATNAAAAAKTSCWSNSATCATPPLPIMLGGPAPPKSFTTTPTAAVYTTTPRNSCSADPGSSSTGSIAEDFNALAKQKEKSEQRVGPHYNQCSCLSVMIIGYADDTAIFALTPCHSSGPLWTARNMQPGLSPSSDGSGKITT